MSGARRLANFPQVPTAGESGASGYAANFGEMIDMPKGTPVTNGQRLRDEIAKILAMPDIKGKLDSLDLRGSAQDSSHRGGMIPAAISFDSHPGGSGKREVRKSMNRRSFTALREVGENTALRVKDLM